MDRKDIISKLEEHYNVKEGDGDWESGCYLNHQWLSLEEIVDVLSD